MIRLTFEKNSADGIYACALAIPSEHAGIEIIIEASTKYVRVFEGDNEKPIIIEMQDGRYEYKLPENLHPKGASELVLTAEIVDEYYRPGENAPKSGTVAEGVTITHID